MKYGILFKEENEKAEKLYREVSNFLEINRQEILSVDKIAGSDAIITLGGDGTLIHKACEYVELGIPLVGINTGNLGFLTAEEADNWKSALEKLIRNEYFVSERIVLVARVGKHDFRAVNEVVVRGLYRAVDLELGVGGEKFLKVLGDGVIVATQTGSTAYSLSAGGPIVDPDLDSILITPINPIGLPIPSAVISPNNEVKIKLIRGDDISLVLDGQEHTKLIEGDNVSIKQLEHKIKLIYFGKHQFIKSLNAKFGLSSRIGS